LSAALNAEAEVITSVDVVGEDLANNAVVSLPTLQTGVIAQDVAKVIVHDVAAPPVPTVILPFTSLPAIDGDVPQLPIVGVVPDVTICLLIVIRAVSLKVNEVFAAESFNSLLCASNAMIPPESAI
jgi:hypothetical protein